MPGFGWLSPMHLVLILAVVLIVVGPGKLPETGQALGKAIRGFREGFEGHDDVAAGEPQAAPPNQPQSQPQGYAPYQPPAAPYGQQPYAAQPPYQGQPYAPQPYPQSYSAPAAAQQPYPPQQYAPFGAAPQVSQPYGQPAPQAEANGSTAEGPH